MLQIAIAVGMMLGAIFCVSAFGLVGGIIVGGAALFVAAVALKLLMWRVGDPDDGYAIERKVSPRERP